MIEIVNVDRDKAIKFWRESSEETRDYIRQIIADEDWFMMLLEIARTYRRRKREAND